MEYLHEFVWSHDMFIDIESFSFFTPIIAHLYAADHPYRSPTLIKPQINTMIFMTAQSLWDAIKATDATIWEAVKNGDVWVPSVLLGLSPGYWKGRVMIMMCFWSWTCSTSKSHGISCDLLTLSTLELGQSLYSNMVAVLRWLCDGILVNSLFCYQNCSLIKKSLRFSAVIMLLFSLKAQVRTLQCTKPYDLRNRHSVLNGSDFWGPLNPQIKGYYIGNYTDRKSVV